MITLAVVDFCFVPQIMRYDLDVAALCIFENVKLLRNDHHDHQ